MKNVIITGAANGVGKAIAEELKNENLMLLDIDEKNLKELDQKFVEEILSQTLGEENEESTF